MYLRGVNLKVLVFLFAVIGVLLVVAVYNSTTTGLVSHLGRHATYTSHVRGTPDTGPRGDLVEESGTSHNKSDDVSSRKSVVSSEAAKKQIPNATSATPAPRVHRQMQAAFMLYRKMITDPLEYMCKNIKYIKNKGEGSWRYCGDADFDLRQPCLVYSFGINYDFTFEDVIGQLGCDVFSFDPSMAMPDHRHSERVMFYQIGVGGEDTDSFIPHLDIYVRNTTVWRMRTLKTIMKALGHANRTIDLLKIDVESSEWSVVSSMLDADVFKQVKQFLVEWHIFPTYPARSKFQQFVTLMDKVKDAGLWVFDKAPHPITMRWDAFNLQSDMGYVNVNFAKPNKQARKSKLKKVIAIADGG